MRFLHTADWHLGRLFYGRHLTDDQAFILKELLALIKDSRLDAIVIAGDIYDRAVPPVEAVELLDEVLARILLDSKLPVIMIAGNHDSAQRLGFANRLLMQQGLFLAAEPGRGPSYVLLDDAYGQVCFELCPYAEPVIVKEKLQLTGQPGHEQALAALLAAADKLVPAAVERKVAVAHAFVAGSATSESERPLSVGGSGMISAELFTGYAYAALGHIHSFQQTANGRVCYAGSLQKYSLSEVNQSKGVNIVDIDAAGQASVERIVLKPRHDFKHITGYFQDIMSGKVAEAVSDDYVFVTLNDKEAILEPLQQLRQLFPYVVGVEKRQENTGDMDGHLCRNYRQLSERTLFASFFSQVNGEALTAEQENCFDAIVEAVYREGRCC